MIDPTDIAFFLLEIQEMVCIVLYVNVLSLIVTHSGQFT